jgi:inositol phosphorylceramide mannosyltransferase catalytic subunit
MIPKIIHQIWVGPHKIPEKSLQFIRKIKELHPDYEYRLWCNDDLTEDNFSNLAYINMTKSYAQKADIMRYEILYRYGGIYLDIDFEIIRCLDALMTGDLVVCNETINYDKFMSIGFIASIKHNKYLLQCINAIQHIDFKKPVNIATGPWFFRKHLDMTDKSVIVLPTRYMYPLHYTDKGKTVNDTSGVYGIHHWDKNW